MEEEDDVHSYCDDMIKDEFPGDSCDPDDKDDAQYFNTLVKLEPLEDGTLDHELQLGTLEGTAGVPKTEDDGNFNYNEEGIEASFVNVQEYLDVVIEDQDKGGENAAPEKKIIYYKKPRISSIDPYSSTDHKCLRCQATFTSIYLLREHTITHKVSTLQHIKCDKCNFKCVKKEMMEKHMFLHDNNRPFECESCSYRFTTSVGLKVHTKVHTIEKNYPCHLCELKFNRYFDLRAHLKIHVEELLLKCEYCDYKCKYKHLMKRHTRIHTGEYPFKCEYCEYKSNFSANLQSHLRTHTGDSFKCDFCNYTCIRKGHLQTHIRTHTGEKPFKCLICDYKCNRKGDLKIHMRTHTGEKPYRCDKCDYRCSDSGSLRYHKRKHATV